MLVYAEVQPLIAEEDPQQAKQTERALADLLSFVEGLRDQEADGRRYTAEEADTLGAEGTHRAEAICRPGLAGRTRLGIEIQE